LALAQSALLPCAVRISQRAALGRGRCMAKRDCLCAAGSGKRSGVRTAQSLFSDHFKIMIVGFFTVSARQNLLAWMNA